MSMRSPIRRLSADCGEFSSLTIADQTSFGGMRIEATLLVFSAPKCLIAQYLAV
jgi:hypothetical protein